MTLPKTLKTLVVAVVMTATVAVAAAVPTSEVHPGIALDPERGFGSFAGVVFWTLVGGLASAFPVVAPRGGIISVSLAPIMAASVLGGPVAGAVVAAAGTTEQREVRLRIPWYGALYNHAMAVLAAVACALTYAWVRPLAPPGTRGL